MNTGITDAPSVMDRDQGFASYLDEVRPAINDRIRHLIETHLFDDHLLPLLMRGKRLRAGVLLLVHGALAEAPDQTSLQALDLACALELAHAASLIVDDMIDEDHMRRGVDTIHISQGTKTAMLDSIGILSLPYTLIAPFQPEYVTMLADAQRKMTLGVMREMFSVRTLPATAWYEAVITLKTGRLFGLAAEWGYMSAMSSGVKSTETLRKEWQRYGIYLGKSMQIADDITDLKKRLRGETSGKPGSEMLLLKAVGADGLIREFFSDMRKGAPDWSKIQGTSQSEILLQRLHDLLAREEEKSSQILHSILSYGEFPFHSSGFQRRWNMLDMLGRSIAETMLEEEKRETPLIAARTVKPAEIPVKE